MSRDQADAALLAAGIDPSAADPKNADEALLHAGIDLPPPPEPKTGMGESFEKGIQQGMSLGMAPRVHAGIDAELDAIPEVKKGMAQAADDLEHPDQYIEKSIADSKQNAKNAPRSVDDLYKEYLALQNKKFEKAQADNPWTSFAGNVTGGLMMPVPGVGISTKFGLKNAEYLKAAAEAASVGKAAPNAAKYAPFLAQMADSGVTGGLMGGAYGLSQSDDLRDPTKDVKAIGKGAALGGVIGTAAPPALGVLKGTAQGAMELGGKVVGPVGKMFMNGIRRGMDRLPNLGTEEGRAQDVEMRGETAYGFANDVVDRVKDLARNINNKYNEVSDQGRQIQPAVVDNWVESQMAVNPNINEKEVLSQLSQLRELINTAKDGHEVEQITRRFFGEGSTDLNKFKLQSAANKMAEGLEQAPAEAPQAPEPTPRQQFEADVARKTAEQEALGHSGVGPVEIEHIPQDDGSVLAIAKQRTFGEDGEAPFIPKKVSSKRIDTDLNGNPDPDQWAEMENLLKHKQAEQRATPHIDHPELELHLEPSDIINTDPKTGAQMPQAVAVIRHKGPAITNGEPVDTGFKKVASKVLPAESAEAAPTQFGESEIKTYPMDDHPGKVLAVEERPILDADGNEVGRTVVRSKVISSENAAKWVDEKGVGREGGRNLSKLDQWRAMLDTVRNKSKWSPSGSGFSSEGARDQATKTFQSGQKVLDQAVPEVVPMRKEIGHLKNIADLLGIDTYDFENNPTAQQQVGPRLQKIMRDLHNADDSVFNARMKAQEILSQLEQVSPLWANELKTQLNQFGTSAALSHKLDKPFNALALSGVIRNFTGPVASGAGHKVGNIIANNSPIVKGLANGAGGIIKSATPQMLHQWAGKAAQTGSPALQQLGSMFIRAANADERARNAILFGIMGQPSYIKWMRDNGLVPPQSITAPEETDDGQ